MGVYRNMPKTKEHFYLQGKFYIASAPIQVTRFPPPKVVDNDVSAVDYWEAERSKQWKQLDKRTRAMFTWPASREAPKSDSIAFSCLSLDALPTEPAKSKPEPLKIVHDIAMDNFCLLIFKISAVEHFEYSVFPAKRTVSRLFYEHSMYSTEILSQVLLLDIHAPRRRLPGRGSQSLIT
jgi:hypothetical protein